MSESSQKPQDRSGTLDATLLSTASLSGPNVVRYRAITERDIAALRNFEKPVSLAVAALFTGIFLAASYPVYQLVGAMRGTGASMNLSDLGIVIGWALALGVAITATFASMRRQTRILDTLDAMQARPQLPAPRKSKPGKTSAKKRTRFGLKSKKKK
jgi:hypothetical protein